MVEHSLVAWKIAALHPNPWWILLPSSWTSPTLNGLLCVNNTTEQKLLLLLPWLKSVRAVRDQDVIIWLWQVLDSFAPCFVGPESWIFENCRSNTSSQCPSSVNPFIMSNSPHQNVKSIKSHLFSSPNSSYPTYPEMSSLPTSPSRCTSSKPLLWRPGAAELTTTRMSPCASSSWRATLDGPMAPR